MRARRRALSPEARARASEIVCAKLAANGTIAVRTHPYDDGGAIAVLCPARLAFINYNGVLSEIMGRFVFSADSEGKPRRVGDILRLSKNAINSSEDNKRRFFCFGDPAMRLAWAPYTAQVETINGKPVDPDNALELTNQKFIRRFNYIEQHSIRAGKPLKDMTLEEMDRLWNEAKQQEKENNCYGKKARQAP